MVGREEGGMVWWLLWDLMRWEWEEGRGAGGYWDCCQLSVVIVVPGGPSKTLVEGLQASPVLPGRPAQSVGDNDQHRAVPQPLQQGWKRTHLAEEDCQPLHTVALSEGPQQRNTLEHWQVRRVVGLVVGSLHEKHCITVLTTHNTRHSTAYAL